MNGRNREDSRRQSAADGRRTRLPRSGFTLLELLVVLAIIALSSFLIGPRIANSLANMEFVSAVKKVAASLRYARNRAAVERIPCKASVDFEGNRLVIACGDEKQEEGTGQETDEKKDGGTREYRLPEGVRWSKVVHDEDEWDSGIVEIHFFPSGASSGGTVFMKNDRKRAYEISIDFVTGMVSLKEADNEGL
jgi:general secretion pathway protein H